MECGGQLPALTFRQARTLVCSDECRRIRRNRMRSPDAHERACSECGGPLPDGSRKSRPFRTCGPECFKIRNDRIKREKWAARDRTAVCLDCGVEVPHEPRRHQRCTPCAAKRRRELAKAELARKRAKVAPPVPKVKPPLDSRVKLDNRLRSVYGITLAEFEAMAIGQEGLCAICRLSPVGRGKGDVLVVDHCHKAGHVRSLLCGNCNIAIGLLLDDPAIVDAAAAYLRRWISAESTAAEVTAVPAFQGVPRLVPR